MMMMMMTTVCTVSVINVIAKHVRLSWLYLESTLVLLLPKDSPVPKADIL